MTSKEITAAALPLAECPLERDQTSCHAQAANVKILVSAQPRFHEARNDKQRQIVQLTPRCVET